MKVKVIIPASGTGSRLGHSIPKQFLKINGEEILALTIRKFHEFKQTDEIIISASEKYFKRIKSIVRKNNFFKVTKIVEGGKLRQDSVLNALLSLDCKYDDIIMVHDAVRPFISGKKIKEIISETVKSDCVIPGLPVSDTIKMTGKNHFILNTVERENLWTVQTPQAFRYDILLKSFLLAVKQNFKGTDEASVVTNAGYKVKIIKGEFKNFKITLKEDMKIARELFKKIKIH